MTRRVSDVIAEWVIPPAEGAPSKLAQVVESAGETIGTGAARSIRASFKAEASHASRMANGMVADAEAEANPALGLLMGGKRGKGAALRTLAGMLMPMLAGSTGNHQSNGDDSDVSELHRRMRG